jgi:hypothetical protein
VGGAAQGAVSSGQGGRNLEDHVIEITAQTLDLWHSTLARSDFCESWATLGCRQENNCGSSEHLDCFDSCLALEPFGGCVTVELEGV